MGELPLLQQGAELVGCDRPAAITELLRQPLQRWCAAGGGLLALAETQRPDHQGGLIGREADQALAAFLHLGQTAPHPEAAVGGEAIALAGIELLGGTHQIQRGFLEGISGDLIVGGQGAAMALPDVGHQTEVVAHQLLTGPQGTAPHGRGCMGWAIRVLLPALDAPRQLQHGALTQRAVAVAAAQPGLHGAGHRRRMRSHGQGRNATGLRIPRNRTVVPPGMGGLWRLDFCAAQGAILHA